MQHTEKGTKDRNVWTLGHPIFNNNFFLVKQREQNNVTGQDIRAPLFLRSFNDFRRTPLDNCTVNLLSILRIRIRFLHQTFIWSVSRNAVELSVGVHINRA